MKRLSGLIVLVFICALCKGAVESVPVYSVYELKFSGNNYTSRDNPVRDIELVTSWVNGKSHRNLNIFGFFDGNGSGSPAGNVFKVRFCPDEEGEWTLIKVISNDRKLNGQNEGFKLIATTSGLHGFWIVDHNSPGRRWYKRSDGSHQYIAGNTMYSFLSEFFEGKPSGGNIADDIKNNSRYFNKVRIGITGDRYPNPSSKPFLDESGNPTDDGNYSYRPNTEWFFTRLDRAVKTASENDLIVDIILNGPDTEESRSVLVASKNNYDITPVMRYIAARYGSFPNIWICLSNEFDIKVPVFTASQICNAGHLLQSFLPYPTPVSVHSVRHWSQELNSSLPWSDHIIFQDKIKNLDEAADNIIINYILGGSGKPVIDDELAYEGKGDGWSEEDVIEAFLGAFAGGGYGSTGYKPANKAGHYFSGNFKAEEHTAADNLAWFRNAVDNNITFWRMEPVLAVSESNIFLRNFETRFRIMGIKGEEYVVAANGSGQISASLPKGKWTITFYDLVSMKQEKIKDDVEGPFGFKFGNSRAQMLHLKKR